MRRISLAAAVILAAVTNLWAQGAGQLPAWNVLGNPSAAASNARSATLNAMFNGAFCSTNNNIVARLAGTWVCATQTQLTALINPATAALSGALPAWPSDATKFFSGAGTYITVPFSSIGSTPTTLAGYGITSPLPYAQGGCNATTQAGCTNNIFPTPTRAGDVAYWNGSSWVTLPGNNSGTNVLQETSAGVPSWTSFVSSAVIAGGTGILTTGTCTITTTGTCTVAVNLSGVVNSLGADVALNNTANYFDGPSVAQGTSGTWFASGSVTVQDTAVAANIICKLWDGTTVIASSFNSTAGAAKGLAVALSGFLTSPAGNIRISCKDPTATTGVISFNATGNSKDATLSAIRITP